MAGIEEESVTRALLDMPVRLIGRCAEAVIRFYQRFISPALPPRCKYEPTCSAYALQAIRSFGVVRGTLLAGWRLLRCNPFSEGGYDPVEAQRLVGRRRVRPRRRVPETGLR